MSPRFFTPTLLLRKSDADLAALVAAGHEAAFAAIVLRHRSHLLRHCRQMLRDQHAEDAVQQTFVRALQALRNGTEVRELRPWLCRVARNVALTELSARTRDQVELNEEWEDVARSGEFEQRASLRAALVAVEALPDRQRTALLRSAAGETPAAIANELGMSSIAVRQLLHRARVSVRTAVQVISPPPLAWLSRRIAAASGRIPRAGGVPAGAAPLATKIGVVVVATATVAAPVTVLRSVLAHQPSPPAHHRSSARRASAPARPRLVIAPSQPSAAPQPSAPAVASPAPPPAHGAPVPHPSPPSSQAAAVSASSPASAPVGNGSDPGGSSAGTPIGAANDASPSGSASSGAGPVATASASGPTQTTPSDSASSSGTAPVDPSASPASPSPTDSSTASSDPSSSAASGGTASGSPTGP